MSKNFKVKNTINVSKLVSNKMFPDAQGKAAIQMLDWMANGSEASAKKPPIRTGVLASSGSVFYKNELLTVTPNVATEGEPTPNKTHSGKDITWGFNTVYASRMHEDKGLKPGPFSQRDPNAQPGNQWVTEHLKKDKNNYTKLIALFIKKMLNKR